MPNPANKKAEAYILVIGGGGGDGGGWGITPSGKVVKIPPNNPWLHIAALAQVAGTTANKALKTRVEEILVQEIAAVNK